MALSGTISKAYSGWTYKIEWKATQDIEKNQSTITCTHKLVCASSYGLYIGSRSNSCTAGEKKSFTSSSISTGGGTTITLGTTKHVVSHNSDGTKNLTISGTFNIKAELSGVYKASITASKSVTLDTIPRKSELTVADGTLGTAQTLTISEKASAFNHKLTYSCGDVSGYILGSSSETSSTLSTSWTPPITLASQNTTGTSVSIKFTLYTYNGSTSIGSSTYTKTFTIPSSVAPTCKVAVSDPTGHLATYGSYIKGQSKFKVDITATTSYGSAIASYGGSANGQNITAASTTTDVLASSGTLKITASVKDQRGRSGTASTTVNVLDYSPASIASVDVNRCVSLTDGTEDMQGGFIQVKFSSRVTSLNNKNKATYVLKYKKKADTTYTSVTLSSYANNYAVSNGTYIFAAATDSSYDVQVTVTDGFGSDTKTASASTAFAIMHWRNEGDGIALGKVAEDGGLEIGMKSTFYENMRFAYSEFGEGMIGGTLSDGTEVYNFQPISEGGNCVVGWGNYNRGDGNTNIYSGGSVNMYVAGEEKGVFIARNGNGHTLINYAAADNANSDTFIYGGDVEIRTSHGNYKPYICAGDSFDFSLHTAGFLTNANKDVCFTIPLTKPVVGNPTITITSIDGFILRQGTKYTHGSSATEHAIPSSIKGSLGNSEVGGIVVTASFTATTNSSNNDSIGVNAQIKVTFS